MKKKEDVIVSLNEDLLTEFSIQLLEERLETDPLSLGNPLEATTQFSAICFNCVMCFACGEF